jgi:hypothetical protein
MNDKKNENKFSSVDLDEESKMVKEENFDPSRLRLSQNFSDMIGVKKAILSIPVRKPGRQAFFRVRPDENFCLETAVLELEDDRETYLVEPDLWSEISGEIRPKVLYTYITRQGVLGLWPIRLPGPDGRLDEWNRTALEAAEKAKKGWIRLVSNMDLRAYDAFEADGNLSDPEWPDISFTEILKIAFKDRFIDSLDHPVFCRLRGEM